MGRIVGLSIAVLLLLASCTGVGGGGGGCGANIVGSAAGWTAVAVGQVEDAEGPPITLVYVGTRDGEILALDAGALKEASIGAGAFDRAQISTNGGLRWGFKPDTEPSLGGAFGSPVVGKELVYFGMSGIKGKTGFLYALNKDRPDGDELALERGEWSVVVEGMIVGGPALTQDEKLVIIGSDDGVLYAFDAKTGDPTPPKGWKFPQVGSIGAIWSTPVVDEERVYFGSLDHKVYALSLKDGSLAPGWPYDTGGAVVARPLLLGKNVIVGSFDRKLYSIDASSGVGRSLVTADKWFWAGAVSDGTSVFAPSLDGQVHVVDRAGIVLGTLKGEGPIVSTPAVLQAEGQTFVVAANERGELYFLDGRAAGQLGGEGVPVTVAGQVFGDQVKAPLIGLGDDLFVGNTDGTVWGLEVGNQRLNERWRVNTKE